MNFPKTIIIIGASSGIGRALALRYGRDPEVRLGLAARRVEQLQEIAGMVPAECEIQHIDLAASDRNRKFEELLSRFPGVDLIIYCAGYGEINPELDWKLCAETLEVNVTGFTEIINIAYRSLARQKGGRLAAISSIAGLRGAEDDSGYSASKAYMIRYLEGLARKSHKEKAGIRITTILPGFVDTAMAKGGGFFWMCSPEIAAAQMVSGLKKAKRYIYVTRRWRLVAWLFTILPRQIYERI